MKKSERSRTRECCLKCWLYRLFELFSELYRSSTIIWLPESFWHTLDWCFCRKRCKIIDRVLKDLGDEELRILFNYAWEWTTKQKLCYVPQFVLFRFFNIFPLTNIVQVRFFNSFMFEVVNRAFLSCYDG